MKKHILITIFTMLILAALITTPVFAANATANVSSVSGNRGGTVTVTVNLANSVTVGSGGIEVSYDSNVLELVKGEWNVTGTTLSTFMGNKGAFAYTAGTAINGKIFTATFKIKDTAAFGDSTVKMTLQLKDESNANISVTNNNGKVTVVCKHNFTAWTSANDTSHTRTCSICSAKETVKHAFTNACDSKCDACGYTRTITHSYKTTWSGDSSKHWHECSICKDKKDLAAHTPGTAATETKPQTCTACGYVIKGALGHTHKATGDWIVDASKHWHNCSTCKGKADEGAHVYDNACDGDCNTCGYKREVNHIYETEWSFDKNSHWHTCTICGSKDIVAVHTPGAEATEDMPQKCTVCQYEMESSKEHEHKYDADYIIDVDGHRPVCKCGQQSEMEAHTFDEGKIVKEPTTDMVGEKHYTCSVCGYVKVMEIEVVIGANNADTSGNSGFDVRTFLIGFVIGMFATSAVFIGIRVVKKKNIQ